MDFAGSLSATLALPDATVTSPSVLARPAPRREGAGQTSPSRTDAPVPLPSVTILSLAWEAISEVRFAQLPSDTVWSALGTVMYSLAPDLYASLLKPRAQAGGAPSPLVVHGDAAETVAPGEHVRARLVLVGAAGTHASRLVELAERVAVLGRGSARGLGAVRLARAVQLPPPPPLALGAQAEVHFTTPVALKADGRVAPPDGALLVRRLAWRARALAAHDTPHAPPDFRSYVALGERLASRFSGRFVPGYRYSARQETRVPTGGFRGMLALSGDALPALAPLLAFGAQVGAGKNAERGYGRYTITAS